MFWDFKVFVDSSWKVIWKITGKLFLTSLTLDIITGPARKFCRAWRNKRLNSARKERNWRENWETLPELKYLSMCLWSAWLELQISLELLTSLNLLFKYLTLQGILQKTRSYGKTEEMRLHKWLKGVNGRCFRRDGFVFKGLIYLLN